MHLGPRSALLAIPTEAVQLWPEVIFPGGWSWRAQELDPGGGNLKGGC